MVSSRRIVVVPDIHLPYEDRKAVRTFLKFLGEYNPDEVVIIGDLLDFPQPSRWSKDTAAEFQGSVFTDCEVAQERFLYPLRQAYGGRIGFIEGNHDLRPREYLAKYSPALAESKAFHIDNMLNFAEYEIEWLPDFYDFEPGWTMTHGHRGGIRLSTSAGMTAYNAAVKFGKSVVMGHTHRLGMVGLTKGYDANADTTWGLEVGHMLDMKLQTYLKGATGNWQQGFGLVKVDGEHVKAEPVPVTAGKFIVDGATYIIK